MNRKLIFFVSRDPRTDAGPLWNAYHFAGAARAAGLDAEIRLAGDAVLAARPQALTTAGRGHELPLMIEQAAAEHQFVSM